MKKILYHIFLLLCIAVFCISAYKLYGYYKSYKEAKDTYEKIKKDNVKKTNGDRTIDFDKLRAKNPDIVGWVYAKGTGIDYPIVQGKDTPYEKWNDVCQAAKIQRRILSKETSCDHFIYSKEDNAFESNQCLCGESTGSDADHICK